MAKKTKEKPFDVLTHVKQMNGGGGDFCGSPWQVWDGQNPPPAGEYIIWDPYIPDDMEKVWTYREDQSRVGSQWGNKKGQLYWYNSSGWQADRPPSFYRPMPRFPRKDHVRQSIRTAKHPHTEYPADTCIAGNGEVRS